LVAKTHPWKPRSEIPGRAWRLGTPKLHTYMHPYKAYAPTHTHTRTQGRYVPSIVSGKPFAKAPGRAWRTRLTNYLAALLIYNPLLSLHVRWGCGSGTHSGRSDSRRFDSGDDSPGFLFTCPPSRGTVAGRLVRARTNLPGDRIPGFPSTCFPIRRRACCWFRSQITCAILPCSKNISDSTHKKQDFVCAAFQNGFSATQNIIDCIGPNFRLDPEAPLRSILRIRFTNEIIITFQLPASADKIRAAGIFHQKWTVVITCWQSLAKYISKVQFLPS
jgi:hypothetical protein